MADKTPTTTMGTVTYVDVTDAQICGLTWGGQVFEAWDTYGLGVAVGDQVLADYLPSARQWCVVAIVT
jgi:hypothetical protein